MKRFLIIVVAMFLSSFMMTVYAQLPNEEITILKSPNNDQWLTISCPEIPNACYLWSKDNVPIGHTPSIVVYPRPGVNVYHATRTSVSYGREEKTVIVNVVECISLEVTPLVECYPSGATVDKNDFKIMTSPPGYEDFIIITPDHVSNNWWSPEETENITFSIMHDRACARGKTVTVNVINEDMGGNSGTDIQFVQLIKFIDFIKQRVDGFKRRDIEKIIKMIKSTSPCMTNVNIDLSIPAITNFKSCCNGKTVQGFSTNWPGFSGTVSFECEWPIPYVAIPKIAGIFAIVGISGGVYVDPLHFKYTYSECYNEVRVPISIKASAWGGARIGLSQSVTNTTGADVLRGEVKIVGSASTNWEWRISEPIDWHPLDLNLSIEADLIFFNFIKGHYKYTFGSVQLFND